MANIDPQFLETISIVIASFSAIVASVTAIIGISAWKKEIKGKRKYELAEDVLSCFYEVQQGIEYMRSHYGFVDEGTSRPRKEGESERERLALDQAWVKTERFQKYQKAFDRLQALKFRFSAVFGRETEQYFQEVVSIVNEIFTAANDTAAITLDKYGFTAEEKASHLRENRKILYSAIKRDADKDAIKIRVDQTINKIEEICRKAMDELK